MAVRAIPQILTGAVFILRATTVCRCLQVGRHKPLFEFGFQK
jgi:hypothetical protein